MRDAAGAEIGTGVAAPPADRAGRRLAGVVGDRLMLAAVLLAVWQALSLTFGAQTLTPPLATLARLATIMADPDFTGHLRETGRAFLAALAIAGAGGLLCGLVLGANRLAGEVAEPILVALYSIPKITLYPVILLLFGLGISAKIAFGALHGIIPVVIFTMNAVRGIPHKYFRAARAMRLTTAQTLRHVVMPAVIPEIVTGFRVGFALTLLGTLIGEMFASQRGLGYMLIKAMEINDVPTLFALALLLIVAATSASTALLAIERRLHGRSAEGR